MKKIFFIISCCLILISCNSAKENSFSKNIVSESTSEEFAEDNDAVIQESPKKDIHTEIKIIKTGRLGIKVTNIEKTKQHIDTLISKYNAYYSNESFEVGNNYKTIDLTIRIPNKNFEALISRIEKENKIIEYKEIQSNDITKEYIDLNIRLENKHNYLNRYRDLLKQAKSVKEILEIEEQIRVLEEEIESTEGGIRFLDNQVDYSTLNLQINKEFEYTSPLRENFFEKLKQSLSGGWNGIIQLTLFIIRIWPLWIFLFLFIWLFRKVIKKRKNKKN